MTDKDKKGIMLIALVVFFIIAIFALKIKLEKKEKPGDDNCLGNVTSNTVFVLDFTDEITVQTKDEIMARAMAHITSKVQVNERVSIFSISDLSKKSLRPIVSLCRPPDDGNRLFENRKLIQENFKLKFKTPIVSALGSASIDSSESPIAQALTDLSLSKYLTGNTNSLLIFSDMLENTPKFSLYRCHSPDRAIAAFRSSRLGAVERPKFTNTEVQIHVIPRLGQTIDCRDKFWPWFFGNMSGERAALSTNFLPGGVSVESNPVANHQKKKRSSSQTHEQKQSGSAK